MRFRNSRLRTKVTALLLSLAALWSFAAWVTLREGVNLLWVTQLDASVVGPSEPVLVELQRERRIALVRLGDGSFGTRKELQTQRQNSDRVIADFETEAQAGIVDLAADEEGGKRLDAVFKGLASLKDLRKSVDAERLTRVQASDAYSEVIDSFYRMYASMATLDDKTVAKDVRTLLALNRAREVLSREDALLAGALAEGTLSLAEHAEFTQTVGAWHILADQAAAELPPGDKTAYDKMASGPAFTKLKVLETRLTEQANGLDGIPFTADQWRAAAEPAIADFSAMVFSAGDRVVDRAAPVAVGVVVRLALAGGLGLIAVIASIILSITTARALFAQLQKLRDAAHELSDERLPGVVERLGRGEEVDVAAEAPPLKFGDDEIGQVGQAFNTVQETAIRVAVEQAELRRSIRDILLSLARRTQGLVHRQLTVLDVMERRETEPEELRDLFRLDHLATRMRRNAENLIVLSGATPGRTWRRSVPMVDVVRGALAEVEDYTRVTLMPMGQVELTGRAVGDVIHLLAELIENAVSFSPPYTMVQVGGQLVANGYVLEIEDRGLGMTDEDLAAANDRINDPPEFRLTGTARLGLYVVSRLAERHQIKVSLKASPYGGTTVVVLIPHELVRPESETGPVEETRPADEPRLPQRVTVPAQGQQPAQARPQEPLGLATALRTAAPVVPVVDEPASAVPPEQQRQRRPESEPQEPAFTPSGLPCRVPQTNLAPALRAEETEVVAETEAEEDDDERSPEEIRAIMGAFQSGTRLGRTEAAKLAGDDEAGRDT
ncbi:nitrate- and nitrite sensing domain-containing protein [Nonomuraea sp. NPDC046570]|uniref:sensor histidine kinase n=1 Tax=Nonomuraea sp. NPDC046570 TaxID=3155255 RepID=UPI0033FAA28D